MAKNMITAIVILVMANICLVFSLYHSDWIISEVGGAVRIGIWRTCITNAHQSTTHCSATEHPAEGRLCVLIMNAGAMFVTFAACCYIASFRSPSMANSGKWFHMVALALLSSASILLPMGFEMQPINGEPFQLPTSYNAGFAYVLYNFALWLVAISVLFSGQLMLPF